MFKFVTQENSEHTNSKTSCQLGPVARRKFHFLSGWENASLSDIITSITIDSHVH